jgi:hypothetical protein|tara:strand:+ start:114 stop:299 length:186 start_codon:yes stop_codon:yes gene_type:complete
MLTIWNHVSAFASVILLNCFTPANWSYCLAVNQWFPPYMEDVKQFYCQKPYQQEQQHLMNE